ncbi:YveK family protein [Planococcus lenghuensis]|uniref:Capsular biosynthesis protein n=1 Tax=Planococcus lenghuensis TaxID=2213202 RepID=A0A1Q2L186_9BACL|nr:Wzz/FepE/Etk N-terminal domain-containing protein [Planococcus lenghuensis]AQQ54218.1 capsular biosynthesis protein [Planococcus lenghuensis]
MEETISLQDIFKTVKKRLGLIALTTILAITIAGIVSFLILTPIYQVSSQILVNQENTETATVSNQDIQANLQLINTYSVIIKSPAILNQVIEQLDLEINAAQLSDQITVATAQNSQVVNLTVQDSDPALAVEIANTITEVFEEDIREIMNVNNVTILTPAVFTDELSPVEPNPLLNMAIAGVIGLMIGVGIAFLLEYLDTSLKNEQDIEDVLNLPVLGLISPIPDKEMVTVDVPTRRRRG